MFSLTYASSATKHLTDTELADILNVSRRNNARVGVTGLLLYHDGNIIQVLEGEEQAVREVFARVQPDARHSGCLILLEEQIESRAFPEWTMGFRPVARSDLRLVEGFNQLMEIEEGVDVSRRTVQLLIENFKKIVS